MEYRLEDEQKMIVESVRGALTRRPTLETLQKLGAMDVSLVDATLILEEAGAANASGPIVTSMLVAPPLGVSGVVAAGFGGAPVPWAEQAQTLLLEHDGALHAVPTEACHLEPLEAVDPGRSLARVTWEPTAQTSVTRDPAEVSAAFDRGALGAAAMLVGLGRSMVAMSVEYAKERKQFGTPIGAFQAVQKHLVDAHLGVELARPLVHAAAQAPTALSSSMAKAMASDAGWRAARAALQVHGAMGYSYEHGLHRLMKRAWALASQWGDAGWHRERVARLKLDVDTEEQQLEAKDG